MNNHLCIILLVVILVVWLLVWNNKDDLKDSDYITLDNLGLLFDPNPGISGTGDKNSLVHDYLSFYEYSLTEYPKNSNVLEIGIFTGASLFMWASFFNKGVIYGIDISLESWNHHSSEFKTIANKNNIELGQIEVFEADATKSNPIFESMPMFDIIIDDGSHDAEDIIKTFELFFPTKLKNGGTFIIEDVHEYLNYHRLKKYLDDLMPYVWLCKDGKCGDREIGRKFIDDFVKTQSDYRYKIKSITFHRDIVVIKKYN